MRIIGRRHHTVHRESPTSFWISYSDLMAGMLLVFILLTVVALFHYQKHVRERQAIVKKQEEKLSSFHQLQREIIAKLAVSIEEERVRVDPDTGVLNIESGILFGEGEAVLSAPGRARLTDIVDAYISVLLSPRFRSLIERIEIEGHTNTRGDYLFNLELSQRRAFVVMSALLDHAGDDRDFLEKVVVASGRSYSDLIYLSDGQEDMVRSRRIELRFRLNAADLFRDIYDELNEAERDQQKL